ncbi:hypothetical protein RiCNE_13900 [Rickettsia endosymbiont of Culicoides newsteadi]|nr:hypothetical protein RiCNE_13900 [Rickettsia endosymbiont of Culicoides newsteadi]
MQKWETKLLFFCLDFSVQYDLSALVSSCTGLGEKIMPPVLSAITS